MTVTNANNAITCSGNFSMSGGELSLNSAYAALTCKNLSISGGTFNSYSTQAAFAASNDKSISGGTFNVDLERFYENYIEKGYSVKDNGDGTYTVYKDFDIYVGGVGMRDGDYLAVGASAATTQKPADSYAHYQSGTLTLHNYSYRGMGHPISNAESAVIYQNNASDLTVVLDEDTDNSLTNTNPSGAYGITTANGFNGKVTVKGGGTMAIDVGSEDTSGGISGGSITVDDVYLMIQAGGIGMAGRSLSVKDSLLEISNGQIGILALLNVQIEDGSYVTVAADMYGIYGESVRIDDSIVEIVASAIGINGKDLIVENGNSEVTVTGGSAAVSVTNAISIESTNCLGITLPEGGKAESAELNGTAIVTIVDSSGVIAKKAIIKGDHTWGDWTEVDSRMHQRVCKKDASHVEFDGHDFSSGDCVCGRKKPIPPTVTSPTKDQTVTVAVGKTATLRITAENAHGYQWFIDRGNGLEPIDGATDASYTTSPVTLENDGYQYYCAVMDENGIIAAGSPYFTLRVTEKIPETGDSAQTALWMGLILLSLAGMGILRKRKTV